MLLQFYLEWNQMSTEIEVVGEGEDLVFTEEMIHLFIKST